MVDIVPEAKPQSVWDTDLYGPRMSGLQFGLSKTFVIHERFKIMMRAESNNWPLKLPELLLRELVGTFTSLRNPFAEPGMSRPHAVVGGRIEF
jgi:hypothetical protein